MGDKFEGQERRKTARLDLRLNVNYQIINASDQTKRTRYFNGVTENVSISGICFYADIIEMDGLHIFEGDVSTKLRVEIELPSGKAIDLVGETMWFTKIPEGEFKYRIGIRFTEVNLMNKERLLTFLRTHGNY